MMDHSDATPLPNPVEPPAEMDPRVVEYIRAHCGPHHYGEQDENGIDLSLIRENLKLTPLERIRQHDAHQAGAVWMVNDGRRRTVEDFKRKALAHSV